MKVKIRILWYGLKLPRLVLRHDVGKAVRDVVAVRVNAVAL